MAVVALALASTKGCFNGQLDLMPAEVSVCFLADRGFTDTQLMRYLGEEVHWHFRIRVKSNTWIHRPSKG